MQPQHPAQIAVSNTETIAGATIVQSLGLVTGSTVRAKNIGKDIMKFVVCSSFYSVYCNSIIVPVIFHLDNF